MLTILVLSLLLIVFDFAAMRWGFVSSDGLGSEEWERRQRHTHPDEYERLAQSNISLYTLRVVNK